MKKPLLEPVIRTIEGHLQSLYILEDLNLSTNHGNSNLAKVTRKSAKSAGREVVNNLYQELAKELESK